MRKSRAVCGVSAFALVLSLAPLAFAQVAATAEIGADAAAQENQDTEVEAVVVTGSLIARTESLALPVDVLTTEELEKKGNLTLIR